MRDAIKTSLGQPRLKRHLHCQSIEGEGVFVLAESEQVLLRGDIYCALTPLLDGSRSVEQIFVTLSARYPIPQVFQALDQLRARGLLADASEELDEVRGDAAFWEALGHSSTLAHSKLSQALVEIESLSAVELDPLVAALGTLDIAVGRPGQLRVVVAGDYLDPALEAINEAALARGQAWLLLRPVGLETWLGPLFEPERTGCWACLRHRLSGHRRIEGYLERKTGLPGPFGSTRSAVAPTTHATLTLAASEIAKWLVEPEHSAVRGRVLTIDAITLETRAHPLTRRPQCPACGAPPVHEPSLTLAAADYRTQQTAGYRSVGPEEMVERLRHHISPITGIVGEVRPGLESSADITPIFIADHNFVEMDDELFFLSEGFRKRSGGKGTSRNQALASALGESIERYCGVFQGDEARTRSSRAALGDAALDPNECMGFSDRQYAERERWIARRSKVSWVPERFDDALELDWTPLWSLTRQRVRYLPTSYCYFGYPLTGEPRVAVADSNGCAAGFTLAEAILQGLLELVERDCVALWWYNRVQRPAVDIEGVAEPYVDSLLRHYRSLERELWVLDITNDLGIPTFAAISRRRDNPSEDIILGFGAHLDPRVARLRALTELNQSLPCVPIVLDDSAAVYPGSNSEAQRWWKTATIASEPYLLPAAGLEPRSLSSAPPPAEVDLRGQVMRCVDMLASKGLETLVLDQSRPDVELRVVRVVVPGLRHFWPRLGPGRLYDVPPALGWLERARSESDLNPYFIYF